MLAPNGKIYGIPHQVDDVLVVDTSNSSVSTISVRDTSAGQTQGQYIRIDGLNPLEGGWRTINLAEIYAYDADGNEVIPANAEQSSDYDQNLDCGPAHARMACVASLVIDRDITSYQMTQGTDPWLRIYYGQGSRPITRVKVYHRDGGYGIVDSGGSIAITADEDGANVIWSSKFEYTNEIATLVYEFLKPPEIQNGQWSGGVLGYDNNVYGIPHSAENILVIHTNDNSISSIPLSDDELRLGSHRWSGGVLGPNGKIYGMPYNAEILLFTNAKNIYRVLR